MAVSARGEQQGQTTYGYGVGGGPVTGGRGRHARPRGGSNGFLRALREMAIIVVSALVLSALVRAFLVQAFYVPSASMEDTLLISDRIIASKITTQLGGTMRGEVIVFSDPGEWLPPPPAPQEGWQGWLRSSLTFVGLLPSDSGNDLVKRVIGVGGDRVACCDDQGRIVLNSVPLDEDYIIGPTDQVQFDVVVPDGTVFVMGDNRGNSRDSRYHLQDEEGGVPVENVVGRVVLIAWPFERFAPVPIPAIFQQPAITIGP